MTIFKAGMLVVGLVALSACSNGGLFNDGRKAAADAAAAAAASAGTGTIDQSTISFFNTSVGDRVLFPVDQATLTGAAVAILDQQAAWLQANPQYQAKIEGHADEQGTRDYNIALGDRRATAVFNYLVSKGVAPGRMTTVSYGKEQPLAICSDESCWSQNRRAVTVVAGGLAS